MIPVRTTPQIICECHLQLATNCKLHCSVHTGLLVCVFPVGRDLLWSASNRAHGMMQMLDSKLIEV